MEPDMSANFLRSLLSAAAAAAVAMSMFAAGAQAQDAAKRAAKPHAARSTPAKVHKVAIQVDENDKKVMNLALNNATNVLQYYKSKGEKVIVEIVTYGPGLHMLRSDTSPVKDRIAPLALEHSNLTFAACANTRANMAKAEEKDIPLISEAKITPSGVVRLMELQGQGYAYIRP
jgi:intracellular sulfur oxidation DsrE/DsrF family protein